MHDFEQLAQIAKLVRYYILRMSTKAGSGHPTSSLSAADIMVVLFFNVLRFDLKNPENPANDRVIFSKGHASPLLYALWATAGVLTEEEIDSYRQFGSVLEGHPTPRFKYVEVATGSLGQGLSIGVGMAIALRAQYQISNRSRFLTKNKYQNLPKAYVLMGDSEMSEGSVWEAIEVASYYSMGNLVGIIDVNRLGQSTETMLGWDVKAYQKRLESFGWETMVIDGHDFLQINKAFEWAKKRGDRPKMIIAKTIKGRGVSFLENKEGWHGKALSEEDFEKAIKELGEIDRMVKGEIVKPEKVKVESPSSTKVSEGKQNGKFSTSSNNTSTTLSTSILRASHRVEKLPYKIGEMIATRKAYGETLAALGAVDERIVALDGEVSNSTFSEIFREKFPKRYFEMFIAEQNMVGVALGISKRGFVPFVSTFAAFFTRAFDQIRMSAYSRGNVKFVGSHSGVSIGEDGPSQMGLEDIAMFRTVFESVVFVPADAVSCAKLVKIAASADGLFYIRTARPATPVIYETKEEFKIGGSKILRSSKSDKLTIVACGVTVHEAIKACDALGKKGVAVRVVDVYSIKPIDEATLRKCALECGGKIITCEDHWYNGGLGDAVLNVFSDGSAKIIKLAVSKMPMSGKGSELLDFEGISAKSIVSKVLEVLR